MFGIWTKEEIKNIILTNDSQCCKALIKLYEKQTETEQAIAETTQQNGVGFNGVDATILTSFAKFYKQVGFLTPKQLKICRKKLIKYCGQLAKIANNQI